MDGVGEVSLFGAPYAMRIWLNPSKLLSYSLTPSDVINAVKAQNKTGFARGSRRQAHPGRAADERHHQGAETAHVRSEFERILLRVNPDGSAVRLRDGPVELGQESTHRRPYNGKPAAGVGIS